ncbi:MAG: DUF1934 domain-containing protein [Oscillospiraceae bacterium]|nr:DUF1934 domain-containing protein [Oscillospiraceae bacterium]MBQ8732473.1 DUF1934 domain-containing protein [Oscillospiraceae bacterium]
MKRDVFITIKGIQALSPDSERDEVELMTVGTLTTRDKQILLTYQESEASGFAGHTTTLTVEGQRQVIMERKGEANTQLILEKGKRHLCHYATVYGDMMIGVDTNEILSTLSPSGGELHLKYTLDINASLASINELHINVKECETTHESLS